MLEKQKVHKVTSIYSEKQHVKKDYSVNNPYPTCIRLETKINEVPKQASFPSYVRRRFPGCGSA